MLLFRSEENIDAWCQDWQLPHGAELSLDLTWDLSLCWYDGRMLPEYAGRSHREIKAILDGLGLVGDFWAL